jgi:hypothetical protein
MFGVKEQSTDEAVHRQVPKDSGLSGYDFLTQRFIYRNPRRMHNGKNLLNLKQLPQLKTYSSVHHVSSFCPSPEHMRTVNHVRNSLVKVHHYLGTEEQYFYRSDPRQLDKNNTKSKTETETGTGNLTNSTTTTKKKKNNPAYFTRGKGRYDTLNARSIYPDQGARAWLKGFVNDVGMETAKHLLEGVGQVGYE